MCVYLYIYDTLYMYVHIYIRMHDRYAYKDLSLY